MGALGATDVMDVMGVDRCERLRDMIRLFVQMWLRGASCGLCVT